MITKSNCPIFPKKLNKRTPIEEPTTPPNNKTVPILKSTLLLFQWDKTPETEGATNWLATEATATGGGIPKNIMIGVSRKPPPTPTNPIIRPRNAPTPKIANEWIGCSAMGK